jgi:phosphatidylglycerophosphate synthase
MSNSPLRARGAVHRGMLLFAAPIFCAATGLYLGATLALLPPGPAWIVSGGAFLGIAATTYRAMPLDERRRPFGLANAVTLARAAMIGLLIGVAAVPSALGAWAIAGLAATALALDAIDGPIARRTGRASAFGARFDMEVDSLFALAAALLLWRTGRLDAWILLIGLPRYAFLLAGRLYAPLRQPLPPRRRRRILCAIQGIALVMALAPIVPPVAAQYIAGMALVMIGGSFAIDILWLLRQPRAE